MKLSVCLNSVTGSLSKVDAIKLSKKLGYQAVEFWENAQLTPDELKAIKDAADEAGVVIACTGGSNNLVDLSTRTQFLDTLKIAIANAKTLGVTSILCTTGQELPGVSRKVQHNNIVDGLKEAAELLEGTGITLNLEPLNTLVNHQGYYLATSAEAFDIVRKVGSPNVKVLYDIYHQQITEGHLIATITANIDLIGHFHVAGNPGRGEPYLGEINYSEVFKAIDAAGYTGYAGLEYWPVVDSMEDSLVKTLSL